MEQDCGLCRVRFPGVALAVFCLVGLLLGVDEVSLSGAVLRGIVAGAADGLYSPQSLIQDARRHGVQILPADVNASGKEARAVVQDSGEVAIRLGLNLIKGLGEKAAQRIEDACAQAPFQNIADLSRRADLSVEHVEALAGAGALDCFGLSRRQALWQAGVAATERAGMLPGLSAISAPSLPGMSAFELMASDVASTGVTHDKQPMELVRAALNDAHVCTAAQRGGFQTVHGCGLRAS